MKKSTLLLTAFSLLLFTACSNDDGVHHIEVSGDPIEVAYQDESCEHHPCASGLECNADFICEDTVQDPQLICPETKDPVCAQKGIKKNGYLNECQARRHGATILHKGFCKNDYTISGSCSRPFTAIGICEEIFEGYEFANGKCTKRSIKACDAEIPFTSEEACNEACL